MTGPTPSRRCRAAVIGNYALDEQESMLRYGALIASLLASSAIEVSYRAPAPVVGRLARRGPLAKWARYIDKFLIFPLAVRRIAARADVVFVCDHSNAFYCRFTGCVPTLLTCHDMLAVRAAAGEIEGQRTGAAGRLLQRIIRGSMRHADHVVCVSAATRDDVERLVAPASASVIENPLHYDYAPLPADEVTSRLTAAGVHGRRYFLHVGGNQWYKNREGVVALFAKLAQHADYREHHLVLAGKPLPRSLRQTIARLGLQSRVVELPEPSNERLNALYCGAEALLFPSLHEGFGWPIVEAQAAGCPVVTSDRAPMRDVAGPDGALLVDPDAIDAAADAFVSRRHQLARVRLNGLRNVARLRRDAIAAEYRSLVLALRKAAA